MPKRTYLIQLTKISIQIREYRMIEIVKRFISGQSIMTFLMQTKSVFLLIYEMVEPNL